MVFRYTELWGCAIEVRGEGKLIARSSVCRSVVVDNGGGWLGITKEAFNTCYCSFGTIINISGWFLGSSTYHPSWPDSQH